MAQYRLTFFFYIDSDSGWPVKKTWARMLQDITNVSWDTDNITYILLAGSGMISPYILYLHRLGLRASAGVINSEYGPRMGDTENATEICHGCSLKYFRKSHGVIGCLSILKGCVSSSKSFATNRNLLTFISTFPTNFSKIPFLHYLLTIEKIQRCLSRSGWLQMPLL